jgi:D-cysteine desulfhydrase/L-cysteate sulfo-lyase
MISLLKTNRIIVTHSPTPIESLEGLSEFIGVDFFVKRDDRLDELGCGHKLRSLEYLLPYHISKGADCVVTFGSLRSNHTKAVSITCAKLSLKTHVLIGGDNFFVPHTLQGSSLITALTGASLYWCQGVKWSEMSATAIKFLETLKQEGRQPALISPEHGTYPGILGFIRLGNELRDQLGSDGAVNILLPVGTGALAAGICVANVLGNFGWTIYGICVTSDRQSALTSIDRVLVSLLDHEDLSSFKTEDFLSSLTLYDSLAYRDYDRFDDYTLKTTKELFQSTGVIFEPNYMLKCCLAARELFRAGHLTSCSKNVMIHTGGAFSLLDLPCPITPLNPLIEASSFS